MRFEFIPSVLSHCQADKNAPSIKCDCHKKCTGFNDDTIPTTIPTMTTTISTEEEKIMTCHYTLLCEPGKACKPTFDGSKTKQNGEKSVSRFNLLTMAWIMSLFRQNAVHMFYEWVSVCRSACMYVCMSNMRAFKWLLAFNVSFSN